MAAQKQGTKKLAAYYLVGSVALLYSLVEMGYGVYLRSLLVLSDGFHNLSDVVAIAIAVISERAAAKPKSSAMTFGYQRMRVVGGLVNSVSLFTLAIYIGMDAIPRLIFPEALDKALVVIVIGALGITVNTFGTLVFAATGHVHSDGNSASHDHAKPTTTSLIPSPAQMSSYTDLDDVAMDEIRRIPSPTLSMTTVEAERAKRIKTPKTHSLDGNLVAVFLHFLGDAVSSVFVMVAGILLFSYQGASWAAYIDPVASYFVVALIISTCIQPIRYGIQILLQRVPKSVNLNIVAAEITMIPGVVDVHDFHVWEMVDGLPIASVHAETRRGVSLSAVNNAIKLIFHKAGIHSSTIQVEEAQEDRPTQGLLDHCENNCISTCAEDNCCKDVVKGTERLNQEIRERRVAT
ncbi:hypothetical protein BZG36_04226 [Bifiguratus adelaidae]|uniref:Cation efflux protein cytoplasmic domain-containing protein n=1 Tax=Bifiguratus adelaidae TaxID=1938954 RepID=A0A261XYC6_9FUNG|nr:hypothetical protein BZG36_04226 [Bifiguratus adelaidae]